MVTLLTGALLVVSPHTWAMAMPAASALPALTDLTDLPVLTALTALTDPTAPTAPTDLANITVLTSPLPPRPPAQSSFAEVVENARRAWATPDPRSIIATGRRLLLQLPGSEARSAVGHEQAVRLVAESLRRAEVEEVRVVSAREVETGQGYAELLQQYRVRGTGEVRSQRVLLAFRRDPSRGGWELVELRVLPQGG